MSPATLFFVLSEEPTRPAVNDGSSYSIEHTAAPA